MSTLLLRDLIRQAGEEPQLYIEKVFGFLDNLKPGSHIQLTKIVKNGREQAFTEVVKYYMKNRPWQGDITFSEDMSSIKKTAIL